MIDINTAVQYLNQGKVIAYPTEAVYGLGCDPNDTDALNQIIAIKARDKNKGLILIASKISQIDHYINWSKIPEEILIQIKETWPGFVTWLLPINYDYLLKINPILYGHFDTIAVRVTAHKVVQEICDLFNGPIVSTSANIAGNQEIKTIEIIKKFVIENPSISGIVAGELGGYDKPSTIIHGLTGKKIR